MVHCQTLSVIFFFVNLVKVFLRRLHFLLNTKIEKVCFVIVSSCVQKAGQVRLLRPGSIGAREVHFVYERTCAFSKLCQNFPIKCASNYSSFEELLKWMKFNKNVEIK